MVERMKCNLSYMNATTCKMFLPTWLKVNKSFKNKYELDFTNSNHKIQYK